MRFKRRSIRQGVHGIALEDRWINDWRTGAGNPILCAMANILALSGPNLHLLGTREPDIYGRTTLDEIHAIIKADAESDGHTLVARQSNHEGELVDWIGQARDEFDGILLNPAALAHSSVAIFDAVSSISIPTVEVHLTNVYGREEFRRTLVIASAVKGLVIGFGVESYRLGLKALLQVIAVAA